MASRAPFALRGKLLLGGRLAPGAVVIEDDTIREVRSPSEGPLPDPVLDAAYVVPGFIDMQVNGAFGAAVEEGAAALHKLAARLPETGVVAYLPTLVSLPADAYPHALAALDAVQGARGAQALGFHLEGPLLAPKRAGAHAKSAISKAKAELVHSLAASGVVRLVTLAPERRGALDLIGSLSQRGIVVSLGHTGASYEQCIEAVDAGAHMATHLYNAMSPFHHRAPGAVGAAWLDDRVTAGLILDGVHMHAASARLAFRIKGPERLALVSDAMAAAGLGPGTYTLGGAPVAVDQGSARLADGTLAGSILTIDRAVRNAVNMGIDLAAALRMASETPARLLGFSRKGRLFAGADADLVLLDEEVRVQTTIVGGAVVYSASSAL